jgi:hypothetical protein
MNDASSASFNSQVSSVLHIPGTDSYVALADRWVPNFVMTKERWDLLYRVIVSSYDHSVKATLKEGLSVLRMPLMGSADTSKARYVWLPIKWKKNTNGLEIPAIEWQDEWQLVENRMNQATKA